MSGTPTGPDEIVALLRGGRHVTTGAHVVLPTSGSTGKARHVRLPVEALRASGEATAARLGGHGRWVLALPTTHVAGLQVIARCAIAGTTPVVVDLAEGFRPDAFAAACASLSGRRTYTSLVPTQLHRLLDDAATGTGAGLAAAGRLDAVLVGGAAASSALLDAARAAGVRVVTTYGMTETAGGCVYDGVPLDGVDVRVRDGRVEIAGPVLADGYVDDPVATAAAFVVDDGTRWLRTQDLGEVTVTDGRPHLRVLGRADDVVVTGGVNVAPAAVERLLGGWGGLAEVCVVGLPSERWGAEVAAVATLSPGATAPLLTDLRDHVTTHLGRPAAPRELVVVPALPLRGPGKVDRRAAADLAAARLGPRH
ncbi:o-succinylbenzoate--CoA ligase [Sanguibacter suaedae]|uniref:AMP-binding protein n=1 Tax=Sanguibacter suaedae TaxID=2795737 RepID=A0A934MA75_9MICO|nr:o-succinylbenzoate--CoA ligase [Sanguibacter suaedae]MBI9113951.1 AMP-binding protein [Sanguibacter suaedae]